MIFDYCKKTYSLKLYVFIKLQKLFGLKILTLILRCFVNCLRERKLPEFDRHIHNDNEYYSQNQLTVSVRY